MFHLRHCTTTADACLFAMLHAQRIAGQCTLDTRAVAALTKLSSFVSTTGPIGPVAVTLAVTNDEAWLHDHLERFGSDPVAVRRYQLRARSRAAAARCSACA